MPTPAEAETRFLARISRRLRFIEQLGQAGLAVYLPTEEEQRRKAVDHLVRFTAHANEIGLLPQERLKDAAAAVLAAMEEGQRHLPHDVQYRNRLKRAW
ncbi:MAG: hypothetical protein RBS40_04575 [Rhodocyclaceae bacterium]|jgi:hypothetical protein|nr:hypothetical protein [Rhodocyclaceae bacterium]